ncbi:MAG: ABC transporter ATP-binding protein/permease [Planctomycetaceae bacterium]|nr:ABC transporter ATP-binding protein/permease [Planctomycetaceae bacterium]
MTDLDAMQEHEYTGRFNLALWRGVLGFVGVYRKLLIRLALLGVVMAACDVAFPILTWIILSIVRGEHPERWTLLGHRFNLWEMGAVYFAVAAAWSLAVGLFIRAAGRLSTNFAHDIRRRAFDHLQDLSFSFYDRHAAGWLVARLTSDCDKLSHAVSWDFLDIVWGTALLTGMAAAMFYIHATLALVIVACLPVLAAVSFLFQKWILRTSRNVRKTNSLITASYAECLAAIRTTKSLTREGDNLAAFQEQSGSMYASAVRNAVLSNTYYPIVFTIGTIVTGLALWAGGASVLRGAIEIETLIFFLFVAREFVFPILDMSRVFAELQTSQAAAERLLGLINTKPEIVDSSTGVSRSTGVPPMQKQEHGRDAHATPDHGQDARATHGRDAHATLAEDGLPARIDEVRFEHVSFAYKPGQPVLEDFNLTARRGQTVALVGPTGGGKTTIVSLLCRFYEPTAGSILLDGRDYRTRSLHWLQSSLGIVLQEPHLFTGTVRENIRYGRLDATDAEVESAARLVHAHEFIAAGEGGYDAEVGHRGERISLGQRQLVALARAVLADPQIFIMDEATSSVDTATEKAIQDAMHTVLAGRISFVIAHRLSTIRRANLIAVIDRGRIVEQGTHQDLIARRGRYYRLYTMQFAQVQTAEILGRGIGG